MPPQDRDRSQPHAECIFLNHNTVACNSAPWSPAKSKTLPHIYLSSIAPNSESNCTPRTRMPGALNKHMGVNFATQPSEHCRSLTELAPSVT